MDKDWKRPIISMSVKGKRIGLTEPDNKVHSIDVFYDKHIRFWTILLRNKAGDQIVEAEYEPNRELMEKSVKQLMKEHNISIVTGIKIK
jgi:hypothetical protein